MITFAINAKPPAVTNAALDSTGTMVHIPLVTFSKSFDRVDHHILLIKYVTWTARFYNQMANILLTTTQTTSKDRQYEVEVHYHQRRRATRKRFRPHWFCETYK